MNPSIIRALAEGARLSLYVRIGDRGSAHWRRVGDLVRGPEGAAPQFSPSASAWRAVWDAGVQRRRPEDEVVVFGVGPVARGIRVLGYVVVAPWMRRIVGHPDPGRLPRVFDEVGAGIEVARVQPRPAPRPAAAKPAPPARRVRRRLAWPVPERE